MNGCRRDAQQPSCRCGVQAIAVGVDIESARCEIASVDKPEIRHGDSAFSCDFVVPVFPRTHVARVVGVPELDKPMSVGIGKHSFRARSTAVAAIIQQQSGITVLLLFQYFESNLLKSVEIGLISSRSSITAGE